MIREELDSQAVPIKEILQFDTLVIDTNRREIEIEDTKLSLKPKEFDLLVFLVRHQGQVLTRELILERVWGWDFSGGSRTVDVHIRWLREKIEKDPAVPQRIITVRGIGYRFEG
jgi:DNA-binding response OmpR family regulator